MKRFSLALSVTLILGFVTLACNLSTLGGSPTIDENAINTSVAQTLEAAGAGIAATRTPDPGQAVIPTITPQPLNTVSAIPSLTPTPNDCNRAKWEMDITIPDGSVLAPNTNFTKTWRITNTGTCTWNTNYAVVYSKGDHMGEPAASPLAGSVAPGATVDVSVNMKSPAADGEYATDFLLRSDTGIIFGTGASMMAPIYVSIEVVKLQIIPGLDLGGVLPLIPLENLVYDFGANYCVANWRNATAAGFLACPGATNDDEGFVVKVDSPKLQDGNVVNGVGLLTHPQWIDGGSIAGIYPLINVENGMKFRAKLGCGFGGPSCNVRFFLRYRIDGGALQSLSQWDIAYADAPVTVDYDLSALAGKKINFVLQVVTNGSSAQDWAHWVNPRIIK